MHQQQTAFENIVEKGEIARDEQFLLFPQSFLLNQIIVSPFVHIFSSPEHKVLMVSYCDRAVSVVRRALSVVRRQLFTLCTF